MFYFISGASLSLINNFVTVNEGDSGKTDIMLCIQLDSNLTLDRPADILLNTNPLSTAGRSSFSRHELLVSINIDFLGPDDYVELRDVIVSIPLGSLQGTTVCTSVFVVGDHIVENDETVVVVIKTVDSDDIITTPEFQVTIRSEETDRESINWLNNYLTPKPLRYNTVEPDVCNTKIV